MPAPPAAVTGAPLNARRRSHLPRITSVACGVARGVRLRSAGEGARCTALVSLNGANEMLPHRADVIAPQTPLPIQPVGAGIPRALPLGPAEGPLREAT